MSDYTPDRWVVVEIKPVEDEPIRKILAGWVGGYLGADEWRMSSGITEVKDEGDYYTIENHSGSVYTCYKNRVGMTGMSSSVFDRLSKNADIKVIDLQRDC